MFVLALFARADISSSWLDPSCLRELTGCKMTSARVSKIGIIYALLSAVLFGASTPYSKLLLSSASPWMMAGLLYIGAGFGLALVHFSRRAFGSPEIEAPLRKSDLGWLALVILAGGVCGPLLLMFGLSQTPASGTALLLNLEALATMVIAWTVFHENVDLRLLIGAGAILAGAILISWQGKASFQWGAFFVAGACLCWGIDNNLTRKLSSSDPVQIAMLKGLVAGAVNTSLAFVQGSSLPRIGTGASITLVGFFGYGVSLMLFVFALRHLGTARTGAYFSLAPFIGAALSVVLLHDPMSLRLIAAGGLMAVGLWFHLSERHEHVHVHQAFEHEHSHIHDEHHQHSHVAGDPPGEPHTHVHRHEPMVHKHPHYPDLHHRHTHAE
jgi:drug/metabolite transporter (DMT)-like permease